MGLSIVGLSLVGASGVVLLADEVAPSDADYPALGDIALGDIALGDAALGDAADYSPPRPAIPPWCPPPSRWRPRPR
ncbi:hypothetical protein EF294_20205 [Gordonia oryzae]|uniref:Uncharacterized protein n=1 Tax=Gordonia oryzae TaxID=2487349 RepID=A0A3N4G683_9ACTN|nr:hypothetical protein EF294_20205 [Gordonia oryzae]